VAINEEHLDDIAFALAVTFTYKGRFFSLNVQEDEERVFALIPAPEGRPVNVEEDALTGVLEPSEIAAAKIHWDEDFPEDDIAEAMDAIVGYMVERGILNFEKVN